MRDWDWSNDAENLAFSFYSAVLNIDNNKKKYWTANQHITMISEWSCETEDWSNDAENVAFITGINYFKTAVRNTFW